MRIVCEVQAMGGRSIACLNSRDRNRAMEEEARAAYPRFQLGVAAPLGRRLAPWKRAADFVFVQVSFSTETLLRWRDANPVDGPVYAGVMVLASENHAAAGGGDPGRRGMLCVRAVLSWGCIRPVACTA